MAGGGGPVDARDPGASAPDASSRLTIYVAHHRSPVGPLPDPPYLAVCNVGPDGRRPAGFSAYDDEGGLPHLNAAYNELSVLHRLQQRAVTEYVGLAHYRRVLLARRPGGKRGEQPGTAHLPHWDWQRPDRWAADGASLLAALGDDDWATPRPYDVRRAGYRTVWEHFVGNHPEVVLRRVAAAVQRLHPDLEPLEDHLRQATSLPLYNAFLGRRAVLDRYGAFLWPVLAACGSGLPVDGYQARWAGFVAERLHGYWLDQVARPSGIRVGVLPLGLIDVPLPRNRQRLTGVLPAAVSRMLLRTRLRG